MAASSAAWAGKAPAKAAASSPINAFRISLSLGVVGWGTRDHPARATRTLLVLKTGSVPVAELRRKQPTERLRLCQNNRSLPSVNPSLLAVADAIDRTSPIIGDEDRAVLGQD